MATFVCIIVLAYSKRQQSQYWIAYTRLYRLFTTPLSSRDDGARVPSPPRASILSPEFSIRNIENDAKHRRGKVSAKRAFTFNFINTEFEGRASYDKSIFPGISNAKPMLFERCPRFRKVSRLYS